MRRRLLAASVGALAASVCLAQCRAPVLRLRLEPRRARPGSIVVVTLSSNRPLSSAVLSADGRDEPLERAGEGRRFRGLLGIDFESKAGKRRIAVEARDVCGVERRVSRKILVAAGKFPEQRLNVDPAYVEPPESERERIASDRETVARVWESADSGRCFRGAFALPVSETAPGAFGARRVFNGQPRSRHAGVDIAADPGTPITAPAPARVALAEELYFSGGTVILDHGAGLFTTYFHLSEIDVAPGDSVAAGQRIGAVGATGRATGPHLHWGARVNRARVNPLDLLKLPTWS
jgi:murein DD-endopeptidase MepM/ murein hydrolase activator NlpD